MENSNVTTRDNKGETEKSEVTLVNKYERLIRLILAAVVVLVCVIFFIVGLAKSSDSICLLSGIMLFFVLFGEMFYSRILADYVFKLSNDEVTPANLPEHANDPDYCPTPDYILWGHHWTSITGAAPIVGPAMAAYYGWLPGILWVVFGCVFSGAVHDMSTLVVSARNHGRSIGDLAGYIVSWRLRIIFLILINFLCILVVAKFMELIAKLFILWPATVLPVWMEIPLAVMLGFANRLVSRRLVSGRFAGLLSKLAVMAMSLGILIILYGFVFAAVKIEDDSGTWENGNLVDPVFGWALGQDGQICKDSVNFARNPDGTAKEYTCDFGAMQFWTLLLCVYAMIASVLPVWVLMQPRDFINSHQLKVVMAALVLGILIKGPKLDADTVRQDLGTVEDKNPIFPMMFTLIACGATSGFHGLVSSGVTSKQLNKMRDARVIGYSGMMGESMVSVLVIIVVCSAGSWATVYKTEMNWTGFITAGGTFLEELGFDPKPAVTVMNVLVVSFAATTLDSGMRIQRVLIGELGKTMERVAPPVSRFFQNIFVQIVISALPSVYIANSRSIGAVWNLFGATNQLVACISLMVCGVYVLRFRGNVKYVIPFLVPITFLLILISWALIRVLRFYIEDCNDKTCDWHSTLPIIPTIIIGFMIAFLVLAVYLEIIGYSIYYLVKGGKQSDNEVDESGKLTCVQCTEETTLGKAACC